MVQSCYIAESTCQATANPSARSEYANQTCKQILNAAICVVPNLAANDAAKVTQTVAAITLNNNKKPVEKHQKDIEN